MQATDKVVDENGYGYEDTDPPTPGRWFRIEGEHIHKWQDVRDNTVTISATPIDSLPSDITPINFDLVIPTNAYFALEYKDEDGTVNPDYIISMRLDQTRWDRFSFERIHRSTMGALEFPLAVPFNSQMLLLRPNDNPLRLSIADHSGQFVLEG